MPTLYCETHGGKHQARVGGQSTLYRDEGESVLIVTGRLASGPWRCDDGGCRARLRTGDAATLLTSFPRWITESMYDYDFEHERRYFAMRGAETMTVYGAAWPGGDVTALLGRQRDRLREMAWPE